MALNWWNRRECIGMIRLDRAPNKVGNTRGDGEGEREREGVLINGAAVEAAQSERERERGREGERGWIMINILDWTRTEAPLKAEQRRSHHITSIYPPK